MRRFAVILAAGASQRMGRNKLAVTFGGKDALTLCVEAFLRCDTPPEGIVIAAGENSMERALALAARYPLVSVVRGGAHRGESARLALEAIDGQNGVVAIHDAARCLVEPAVIEAAYQSAVEYGSGVAAVPVRDTLRKENGEPVSREGLFAMQTPQAFYLAEIKEAYRRAELSGLRDTDDCGVYRAAGYAPRFSKGSLLNQKLTYQEDVAFFEATQKAKRREGEKSMTRIGYGEDTHALVPGRPLILGGVEVPYEKGLLGHSDADALAHAVTDALLGAAALGDIGRHFPDTEERYRGVCSLTLLREATAMLAREGYSIENVDAAVVAERPKLAPYIGEMRRRLAEAMGIHEACVSVKATTTEGMNDEGRGLCITARAVCLIKA